MDYKSKYYKYKNKYLNLKNHIGGSEKNLVNNNYLIGLLWYNKQLGPIQQISNNIDLQIKETILNTYKMYKEKYNNPNVVLFLNFDKIIPEDFDFFRLNNIIIEDINEFNIIKTNEQLTKLFNPERYSIEPCPVYIYVDMLKILIQYEQMTSKGYEYVIFSDLDIKDEITRDTHNIICKMPDLITTFREIDILDYKTINLLDNFGYLMAGFARYENMSLRDIANYKKFYHEDPGDFQDIITIDGEIKKLVFASGENSFLISKNTPNVIKAIKEYFIDYIFCDKIFNDTSGWNNNYIFLMYKYFYCYLNFLNEITNIIFKTDINSFDDFNDSIDYILLTEKVIEWNTSLNQFKILSDKLCLFLIKNNQKLTSFLTEKGKIIISNLQYNIYPIIQKSNYNQEIDNITLMPFKCVPIDRQKNSSF